MLTPRPAPAPRAALPRETRDTLFLLAVIAWVVGLQAAHLPGWTTALTAAVLGWRAWLAWRTEPLPGWPWRLGLLLLTLGATWATHRTLLGQDAGVTLVVVLLALKTLELRARRDAFVVFFLGFFTLLTHFFHSQSLPTAAGILVALLGLLTAVVNAHMPVGRPSLWQAARTAGGMALLGAPVMVVLFLLFPRMAPLWGVPSTDPVGRSGLSSEMRVGEVARLALDDSIALRVRFDGPTPPAALLYFRGPVLGDFDGQQWRAARADFPSSRTLQAQLQPLGQPVRYEVTLEPSQRPWLMVLDASAEPPTLPVGWRARMSAELQWLAQRPVTALLRYEASSHLDFRHGPTTAQPGLRDYLGLPPGHNPRTLAWAQSLRREHGSGPLAARALVDTVLRQLGNGEYRYTLEPGVYGQHTADEFWFDRKEGFCEHIASGFVVLMRALNIPARVVTGYQGGERNPVDGYWTVRQRDAHAWAEVWLAGEGWVRVDPTGSVSPARIGELRRLQAPVGAVAGALRAIDPTLLARWRANWEALNNQWNQWVLNYTQGQQLELLRSLGFSAPGWQDLALVLLAVIVAASAVGAGWALWERRRQDPWLRLLAQARRRLRSLGVDCAANTPPRELARRLSERLGEPAAPIADWLLRLEAQRYAPHSTERLPALRREFRRLRWPMGARAGPA